MSTIRADEKSIWKTDGVLLYTASGLDAAMEHHLSIENLVAAKHLVVDYAIVTQLRPAKSYVSFGFERKADG